METNKSKIEQNPFQKLTDELYDLQKSKNDGRGVDCVQTLIYFLRQGNIDKARAVALNEADKIVRYSDIRKILQKELFVGLNKDDIPIHFQASSDRWYDKKT